MTRFVWAAAALLAGAQPGPSEKTSNELVAKSGRGHRVDASSGEVFGLKWRRPLVRMGMDRLVGASFGSPGLSRVYQLVVVGSGEGDVKALSTVDGHRVWRYEHGVPFESNAVIVDATTDPNGTPDELALLGSRDGSLLALEVPSGRLRWKVTLDGDPRAPPTRIADRLLVTTANNKLFAIELETGAILWSGGRPAPTGLTVDGHARAVVHGETVFTAFSDGYVAAYRLADGSSLWTRPLSLEGGDFVDADADPVVAGGLLFVASYSDGVLALDPSSGQTVWRQPAPSVTALASFQSLLVVGSADGFIWGLEQADGRLAYRTRMPAGPLSRFWVRDGVVTFTSGETGLVVLDAQNGRPLQATGFGGGLGGDVSWVGEHVALVANSGYLYLLQRSEPPDGPQ